MKKLVFILFLAVGINAFGVFGQTKTDDILRLLRISGTSSIADQMMEAMIPQFQQIVPGIPSVFWERFREKLDIEALIYECVPAYNRNFTHDEIKQLIAFYESPIGKRLVEVTPLINQETMAIGQRWGEQLGLDIVNELIKEGYLRN